MKNESFTAQDRKYRGVISQEGYTLLLGAGISFGIIPAWSELTRSIINTAFNTNYDKGQFEYMTCKSGWGLDAWVQAAANEYLKKGRTLEEFDDLIESALYSKIRQEAAAHGLEVPLVQALNGRGSLTRDEVFSLCDFFENVYGDSSLVVLARTLAEAGKKDKLPVAIITFNADTLLSTVLDLFLIREHSQAKGRYIRPRARYAKVFRGLNNTNRNRDSVPIFHCHGALVPTPLPPLKRRDSRDKLIFKENDYLQASLGFTTWAQNIFLHHAQSSRLLIIGYSLGDTDVRRWLYWANSNACSEMEATGRAHLIAARHFWLNNRPADADEQNIQQTALHHIGVRTCWLDDWKTDLRDALTNLIAL